MTLDLDEVRRIARLAHLDLTAEEEKLFAGQLSDVVASFDFMRRFLPPEGGDSLDQPRAEPSFQRAPAEAADVPAPGLPREVFLANAPSSREGFLIVPAVRPLSGGAEAPSAPEAGDRTSKRLER